MATAIGASTGWYVGLVLGHRGHPGRGGDRHHDRACSRGGSPSRRAPQCEGVDAVRAQTDALAGIAPDQRLRRADPALGPRAAQGGGGQMSNDDALGARARHRPRRGADRRRRCCCVLVRAVRDIEQLRRRPARRRGQGRRATPPTSRSSQATAPVLGLIVEEAVVQDGYMNALTDGYGERGMSTLTVLSVLLAVVVVAVLAVALIEVRRGLRRISAGPGHARRRARDRRVRAPAPARARREGDQRPVRHRSSSRAAGHRRQGRDRRRAEAAMTLWWIGDVVLLLVVLPVVVVLLHGVLDRGAARSSRASAGSRRRPRAGSKDLDAVPLLLTTQDQVIRDGRERRRVRRLARRDPGRRLRERDARRRSRPADRGRPDRARARLLPRLRRSSRCGRSPTGLDETIAAVGEIVEKTAPVDGGRRRPSTPTSTPPSTRSRACWSRRPGWRTPSASSTASTPAPAREGFRNFPESSDVKAPRISEVYTRGHADARAARPRGADRRREPGRRAGAAQRDRRQPGGARALSRGAPDAAGAALALAGHRSGRRAVRAEREPACAGGCPRTEDDRCRPQRRLSTSGRRASRARSRRSSAHDDDARIIAGGHSLLPMMKLRLASPAHLIDINDLTELAYIREEGDELAIGALTRHVELLESELLAARFPVVPRRRAGDRRPGGPQPRHDRRLAVPGRRGRGPLRGLRRAQGAAS